MYDGNLRKEIIARPQHLKPQKDAEGNVQVEPAAR
jgi:ribosomal protein L21E